MPTMGASDPAGRARNGPMAVVTVASMFKLLEPSLFEQLKRPPRVMVSRLSRYHERGFKLSSQLLTESSSSLSPWHWHWQLGNGPRQKNFIRNHSLSFDP